MIIIWSNILVYTLVQKLLLPRLTLATECYYIFNTRIFGIQDCFTSSPHYKNHSDSGFVSHVIRLHISTSSCLLSRCVFRPALGCSSYTDISYQDIHIYLITIITINVFDEYSKKFRFLSLIKWQTIKKVTQHVTLKCFLRTKANYRYLIE